jgi:glutathione synthase/RimK-type ligase-like ATP-grasp enzyme
VRVAILVPAADYPAEWRWAFDPQAGMLQQAGIDVAAVPWTSTGSFAGFDLVLPLVAWGYHHDWPRWLRLLGRFEVERVPLANPVPLLRWNSDKAYLAELASNGVSTVPSMTVDHLDDAGLRDARERFACDQLVVKPLVSASAHGTFRIAGGDTVPDAVRGWRMLVQPWLHRIVDAGEYSLIFFDGTFSHAVRKLPRPGEFRVQPEFGGIISRCEPPDGATELALQALELAPAASSYARVDLVVGNTGELAIIELELIEPALFVAQAPDAAPRFAAAVASAAQRAREQPLADGGRQVWR